MASWLVRSTPERAFRVQALARDIVLCSWARHLNTLTVPLSTKVYKWVQWNLDLTKSLGTGQIWSLNGGIVILKTSI